ncbi:MAG: phosphodiester glycosidase family protein [Selenomonadaceae bacterium]|nr:phosphodiester glycosidase family protein [Selenomonadaceae bacterium]
MMSKNFFAVIFAATFFISAVAQASVQPFELENEEIPELDPEYKDAPTYEEDEKPPETETPTVENEGLEFLIYNENGVMAFAIIADHEKYQLRPILAKNQIKGRATVSQMTKNLDDIAIINASYFMPSGSLIGVTKIDGEIIGVDDFYRSAIGIYDDGSTIFGRVKYIGEINFYGDKIPINGVNCERGENSLVVYNGYFGETTGTNNFGVEIVVEGGVITGIFYDAGNNYIPIDGYIISAHGTAAEPFKSARVHDKIKLNQDILSEDGNFNAIPTVIGAGPRLVMDGKIFVTAAEEKFPADIRVGRAPRSAVGVTSYGDYILAVVDGRQAHSRGCTLQEWADILLNKFGAFNAINLDGGGSTELIVKDKLVNKPSDGRERMVGDALAILPK